MKSRCENAVSEVCPENFSRACLNENDVINRGLAQAKQALWREYSAQVKWSGPLLQLALQEAEALAWQTEYPHLIFPLLGAEKAEAAVIWQQRQSKINDRREAAFAE